MRVELTGTEALRFDDGSPVRAASAALAMPTGLLVVQDDATHACWHRTTGTEKIRLLPPVEGHDTFSEAAGTKQLKPDLEAACRLPQLGPDVALLLGSGSTPRRMRAVVVDVGSGRTSTRDLAPLHARAAALLGIDDRQLNLEGACVVGDVLRWFQRGRPAGGLPTASVDVPLEALLDALARGAAVTEVPVRHALTYDLGEVDGTGLAITDVVALPDGRLLVSAAAEDSPDAYDDGPVLGSALALLDGADVLDVVTLPRLGGRAAKVEGLTLLDADAGLGELRLLAVADQDDPATPSPLLTLRVGP
ncbi:hypothetical protein NPS01_15560 [Nocardioides psychrotolerans]|uniref:Uncharacterized protein n=1 Tax=Nocardioides psychrotolerans TaxID=1005945 RepID=A0A1I3F1N4_9ACTN|nr:hypothetical protein [Nocardioides psychrotolerans]GEP37893.1 hypothetical protein NPS01_15560 [Nocardioides psychrotolerans]SFI05195.1 hypothetical protein SAMN05216561_104186 [Nocardioides psychrotolerans]